MTKTVPWAGTHEFVDRAAAVVEEWFTLRKQLDEETTHADADDHPDGR